MTEHVISTSRIHPRDRFDYWFQATCRTFVPYECRAVDRARFRGELRSIPFAGYSLSTCGCNGLLTWRTGRQALQGRDTIYLCSQLMGTCHVSQNGRETSLSPGDLTLIDSVGPNTFNHPATAKVMVIELSRKECEARLGSMKQWTARRIGCATGAGSLVSNFVRLLPDQTPLLSEPAQRQIAIQIIELLALAFAEGDGTNPAQSSARFVSLLRLKGAVDAALTHCDATCEELAAAAGISVRYANQLLETEDTSLQRLLFTRRIEKCQAALADPAQAHRQISDIAYSWGFGDVSHFGRLFKGMVGLTPRDFRRQCMQSVLLR